MTDVPGSLSRAIQALTLKQGMPPLDLWDPQSNGPSGMHIDAEGSWHYNGSEMKRASLVRLFSTILRLEDDGVYYLVTPGEKLTIEVEDAPFVVVDVEVDATVSSENPVLSFTTNLADKITLGADCPMWLKPAQNSGLELPYIKVRGGLTARVGRNMFYYLIENHAVQQLVDGQLYSGIYSSGCFYPLGTLPED